MDGPKWKDLELSGKELIKLREGIARLAQKAGVGDSIPGMRTGEGNDAGYQKIHQCAMLCPRGWNALLARLMDHLESGD